MKQKLLLIIILQNDVWQPYFIAWHIHFRNVSIIDWIPFHFIIKPFLCVIQYRYYSFLCSKEIKKERKRSYLHVLPRPKE